METNTNRYGVVDRRRPRAQYAQGSLVNRPIPADRKSLVSKGDFDEEEELIYKRRQPHIRGGYGYGGGRNRRGYQAYDGYEQTEGGDFHLKVDLPNFNGTFNIEEFLDWLEEVEHFFDYMDVSEEQRVKTVACKLKGGASAW